MRTWRRLVILLVIAGTAFLFYRWWQAATARVDRGSRGTVDPDDPGPRGASESRAGDVGPAAAELNRGGQHPAPTLDRARADRMREQIRALLAEAGPLGLVGEPLAAPSASHAAAYPTMPVLPDAAPGQENVDPRYLQDRLHDDLFPLAKSCYADAQSRDPTVAGKAVLSFSIVGDRKVGGVVDGAKLTDDTTIADPEFRTCVVESMMKRVLRRAAQRPVHHRGGPDSLLAGP